MRKNIAILLTIVALLVIGLLSSLQYTAPVTAAPFAAPPTPVAGITDKVNNDPALIIYSAPLTITTDTRYCSTGPTGRYDTMDLQYVINQGVVNTTTLKVQYSNDQRRWIDGANVVATNNSDTSGLIQIPVFGWWTCLYADVTNSNGISLTLIAVGK